MNREESEAIIEAVNSRVGKLDKQISELTTENTRLKSGDQTIREVASRTMDHHKETIELNNRVAKEVMDKLNEKIVYLKNSNDSLNHIIDLQRKNIEAIQDTPGMRQENDEFKKWENELNEHIDNHYYYCSCGLEDLIKDKK